VTQTNSTAQRIEALLDSGSHEAAIQFAVTAAHQGDADALYLLALWHVYGEPVERNFATARTLFGRAGEAGHAGAAINHAVFVALGAGGLAPNWASAIERLRAAAARYPAAASQLAIIEALTLDKYGNPAQLPSIEHLSQAPEIGVIRGLFTSAECAHIRDLAAPLLTPSIVVDSRTGKSIQHPVRTSDGAVLGPIQQDMVLEAFNRRIAAVTKTRAEQGEPLTILRYRPGEQYRLHHDCLPGEANQRVMTVICYLNDGYQGGTTEFPVAGIEFRGEPGDALIFRNTLADGNADERSRHAGLPVTEGEKWIATRWIRFRNFDPWGFHSPAHPRR
jgi:prolyl 4-hydroxylase